MGRNKISLSVAPQLRLFTSRVRATDLPFGIVRRLGGTCDERNNIKFVWHLSYIYLRAVVCVVFVSVFIMVIDVIGVLMVQ